MCTVCNIFIPSVVLMVEPTAVDDVTDATDVDVSCPNVTKFLESAFNKLKI